MLRAIPFIVFIILCRPIVGQVDNDTINQKIISQLQSRLPESWNVNISNDTLKIFCINSEGFYDRSCCPRKVEIPKERKLLKWLKNDYLTAFYPTVMKISDTLMIEITSTPTWNKEKIDSAIITQDSIKKQFKSNKVEICKNPYWYSNSTKQIIPFYSETLNCSVFFDRPSAFDGIYKVDYEYGIPRFINIDDELLMVQQIAGLILGINETCFTCQCEEN